MSDFIPGLSVFGNVVIRDHMLERTGDTHEGHTHNFDHMTAVVQGAVIVDWKRYAADGVTVVASGRSKEFIAPARFVVRKDTHHEIKATRDLTRFWCVFALRDKDGEVSDHFDGSLSPYE